MRAFVILSVLSVNIIVNKLEAEFHIYCYMGTSMFRCGGYDFQAVLPRIWYGS